MAKTFACAAALPLLICCKTLTAQSPNSQRTAQEPANELLNGWEGAAPEADDPSVNWMDTSQHYLANQTHALVNWMDSFFGDADYDLEQAESIVRIELTGDWDSIDGGQFKSKIRGRVHMPRLSKRVSLVFSGDEQDEQRLDDLVPGADEEDRIGLQFTGRESDRSRFDYTFGWAAGHLRPGISYRREGPMGDKGRYRLTERIQYEHEKNFYSRTQLRLSRSLSTDQILNWSNRMTYGERTEGVEWSTQLSLSTRYRVDHDRPIAVSYFVAAAGATRPEIYASNYAAGVLYRRQSVRDYLFVEFEPSVNYRQLDAAADRELMWRAVFRLEIALSKTPRKLP